MKPGGRIALVAFDLDGTLVDDTVYVWQTLHDHFRTDPAERDRVRRDHYAGRITYEQWFEHDMRTLMAAGADRKTMNEALGSMRLMDGSIETLETLRAAGIKTAVVSGSLDIVLRKFFPDGCFDDVLVSRVEFDVHGKVCGWQATPYDLERKSDGLRLIAGRMGIPIERCAFVGDNKNDVAVARAAGYAISFNSKSPELDAVCDVVVRSRDLRDALRYLLVS
jgi:phosphoserine phosphatase